MLRLCSHLCGHTPHVKGFSPLLLLPPLSPDKLLNAQCDLFDSPEEIRRRLNTLKSPEPQGA